MTKFKSKYVGASPDSDLGLLKYPYHATAHGYAIYLATPEEAEALLDECVELYPDQRLGGDVINAAPAFRKLAAAWQARDEYRQKQKKAEQRFQQKEDEKARRRDIKEVQKQAEWLRTKRAELQALKRQFEVLRQLIDEVTDEVTPENYDRLFAVYSTLGPLRAPTYNHHYGVISSKHFHASHDDQNTRPEKF